MAWCWASARTAPRAEEDDARCSLRCREERAGRANPPVRNRSTPTSGMSDPAPRSPSRSREHDAAPDLHLRRRGALRRFIRAALQNLHGEGVRPRGLRGLRAPWGGGRIMLTGAGLHGSAVSGVSRPSSQRGGAVAEVVHARGALALIRRGGGAARKTEGCAVGALLASLLTGNCCGRPRPR